MEILTIQGDQGEGGGQILRTALSLSLCQQTPFRIVNIRARRKNPGLRPQHLMAVLAAARLGNAELEGAQIGSQTLSFIPHGLQPGDYQFDIGTAGSTTLLLQTLLPALITARAASRLTLIGGTHNPLAPPFDFIRLAFLPLLQRMGARIDISMERAGFFPIGGGIVHVAIEPVAALRPLQLMARGKLLGMDAVSLLAGLPDHIAERELGVLRDRLALEEQQLHITRLECLGQGNALLLVVRSEQITEVFTAIGQRGVRAETVANRLAGEVQQYLQAGAPVGPYLADQLLLPLALAGAGEFITLAPDPHTPTNIGVIQQFLDTAIHCEQRNRDNWLIRIKGNNP